MTPLQRRLAGCIPLLDFGLDAVLRVLSVEETTSIPSAAIPVGGTPRLLVNPNFVAEVCQTDEELAVLVLHELHHLLLGHTRLFPRVSILHNIAFDAVINAMIVRTRPDPRWFSWFQRLYSADRFPEFLLRPPDGFPGEPSFPPGTSTRARLLLTDLYYGNTGTFQDAFELLLAELPGLGAGEPFLLGSHGGAGSGESLDPGLAEAIARIAARWPPVDARVGRSLAGALQELVRPPAERREEAVLVRALLAAARRGGRRVGSPEPASQAALVAWPSRDRRAFASAAAGAPPLLYASTLRGRPRPGGRQPVSVYVDVSGSVATQIPRLLAAIVRCREHVAPTCFQFSMGVEPVSIDQMARGVVRTSHGTDGVAFAEHLVASGARAAVVITDGDVGCIPPALAAGCRRANLQVVLTPEGRPADLADAAAGVFTLEPA